MDNVVLTPLNALESSLSFLLASLTTTPTFSGAPAATGALLTADDALTSALVTLRKHQQNYAQILHLRQEAVRLEEQVKIVVRTCGELRTEIGAIHPTSLDDSAYEEDDDGEDAKPKEVDYATLMSFARRIGKYNHTAAKEAEEDSLRRQLDAKKQATGAGSMAQPTTNGNMAASAAGARSTTTTTISTGAGNIIAENERAWLDELAATKRAAEGMAFPAAERLRLGMLGQLQLVREQGGEEAVGREIARLLGQTREESIEGDEPTRAEERAIGVSVGEEKPARDLGDRPPATSRPPRPPERKKSIAKPLDLDLWNEDDDDED